MPSRPMGIASVAEQGVFKCCSRNGNEHKSFSAEAADINYLKNVVQNKRLLVEKASPVH